MELLHILFLTQVPVTSRALSVGWFGNKNKISRKETFSRCVRLGIFCCFGQRPSENQFGGGCNQRKASGFPTIFYLNPQSSQIKKVQEAWQQKSVTEKDE